MFLLSLPMRERGLKYTRKHGKPQFAKVAPRAGAWISIRLKYLDYDIVKVKGYVVLVGGQ